MSAMQTFIESAGLLSMKLQKSTDGNDLQLQGKLRHVSKTVQ